MKFAPHDYQAYAIDYIETHPVAAVLLDMGLGKTVISLTAIADLLFDSFVAHRVLVIAPLRVARDTWPAEISKWSHLQHLTYTVAVGSAKERRAALMRSADITIINRENLSWLIEDSGFHISMLHTASGDFTRLISLAAATSGAVFIQEHRTKPAIQATK